MPWLVKTMEFYLFFLIVYLGKTKMGSRSNNLMSPPQKHCVDLQLGLLKSTNSVGNINTAKTLQKSRKQFASRRKRSLTGGSW